MALGDLEDVEADGLGKGSGWEGGWEVRCLVSREMESKASERESKRELDVRDDGVSTGRFQSPVKSSKTSLKKGIPKLDSGGNLQKRLSNRSRQEVVCRSPGRRPKKSDSLQSRPVQNPV